MELLKIFILATVFVLTSGSLFSEFFKDHRFLTFLASLVAIISSLYLVNDVYLDIKNDIIAELRKELVKKESIPLTELRKEPIPKEPIPKKPIPKKPIPKEPIPKKPIPTVIITLI